MSEKQKTRRAKAKLAGLCRTCCKAKALPDRSRCARCHTNHRAYQQVLHERRKEGRRVQVMRDSTPAQLAAWCVDCQACGFHRAGCENAATGKPGPISAKGAA